ncbi:MAG: hypothetical protein ACLT2I_05690, partial [Corynebacterium variabile]
MMRSWTEDRAHEVRTTVNDMIAHYMHAPVGKHYLRWATVLVDASVGVLTETQERGLRADISQAWQDTGARARGAILSDTIAAAQSRTEAPEQHEE